MNRHMIAIGDSAGSLDTLRSISSALPQDFAGNVFVVVHIGHSRSRLPELHANSGHLPVMFPADGETITPGHKDARFLAAVISDIRRFVALQAPRNGGSSDL